MALGKLPFAGDFRELIVYQKAFSTSVDVHQVSLGFPRHEQFKGIADQMRRASKGICANIAEGHGKIFYSAEWKRFLMMALGSAKEMQVWSDYALKLGYITEEKALEWEGSYIEILKMIHGIIQKLEK